MTSRLTSVALDLSRLPAPLVIETLDHEALRLAYIATFVPLIEAATGIDYDVEKLRTDPAIIVGEALSFLRMLDRGRVNDAAKAVLVAHATGADLDNLAAFYGVDRMADEGDDRLRQRLVAAPDAYSSAGTVGAYVLHAMTASLLVKNVGVRSPRAGAVLVSVLSSETGAGTPSNGLLKIVRDRLNRSDIRPLTVELIVQAAAITEIDAAYTLLIPPGPDDAPIKLAAQKAIIAYAAERHRVGSIWRWDGAIAAVKVAGVEKVLAFSQSQDVDPGPDGAVFMRSLSIEVVRGE